jgi:prepilin-type N-terminal cleavage/methylation domain-containing protein
MRRNLLQSKNGFSFIEVLVATVILSIVLVGLFQMFSQGTLEIYRAKNKSLAISLVNEMMEMIAASFHPVENYNGFSTNTSPLDTNPVKNDLLRWKREVTTFQDTALGTISVTVDSYKKTITIDLDYINLGKRDRLEIRRTFPSPQP